MEYNIRDSNRSQKAYNRENYLKNFSFYQDVTDHWHLRSFILQKDYVILNPISILFTNSFNTILNVWHIYSFVNTWFNFFYFYRFSKTEKVKLSGTCHFKSQDLFHLIQGVRNYHKNSILVSKSCRSGRSL